MKVRKMLTDVGRISYCLTSLGCASESTMSELISVPHNASKCTNQRAKGSYCLNAWMYERRDKCYHSTGIPHFIALSFTMLCRCCVFYKLNICGNPESSKSTSAIFQPAQMMGNTFQQDTIFKLRHVYGFLKT